MTNIEELPSKALSLIEEFEGLEFERSCLSKLLKDEESEPIQIEDSKDQIKSYKESIKLKIAEVKEICKGLN